MSHIELSRVDTAAREFHREWSRHVEQLAYLGEGVGISFVAVLLAANERGLALQGRDYPWDPPNDPNPGLRKIQGLHDLGTTIHLYVIRNLLPRMLEGIGRAVRLRKG